MIKTEIILFDVETAGLTLFDPISCISYYNKSNGKRESFCGPDEKKIIESFWNVVKESKDLTFSSPKLVTYNGDSFDIPHLFKRSIVHNIKVQKFSSLDVRKIANAFFISYEKKVSGTLSDWAEVLGLPRTKALGSEMPQLYYDKKFEEIAEHCREDIEVLSHLYERLLSVDLIT